VGRRYTRWMRIELTDFARGRLFPRQPRRNTIQDITPEQFERYLNDHEPLAVLDGYASFCKLHVHRNWTSTRLIAVPITEANRHLLRSGYEARTRDELPVLVRWFEGVEPPAGAAMADLTRHGPGGAAQAPGRHPGHACRDQRRRSASIRRATASASSASSTRPAFRSRKPRRPITSPIAPVERMSGSAP